ncbi:MAG TPA: bifunctional sulfate adenylyltransferase/adenylylsulfate kinase [Candidatus Saccharimonadales bacterium]|nr:bifunctional sulfate adenylyltransferase/adenylylsulfate kinase [Candidatus Saccharimonadales bacterium]
MSKDSIDKEINLTPRQICDVEMICSGGFAPLAGFLNEDDYKSVCKDMRLASGKLWPMPITLDVDEQTAKSLSKNDRVNLRDQEGVVLAVLNVGDVWKPDKDQEATSVFGTKDEAHPAVNYLMNKTNEYYVGGRLETKQLPTHYDFNEHRYTPKQLRAHFKKMGWNKVVAFQTRNPMHRAHVELTLRAAKQTEANLLIHPSVGMTKPGDVDHYTRVRVYQHILKNFPQGTAMIALLPLAMRMGGPREALWHMLIRKNYGATHFIIGRDHAGPGKDSQGKNFYDPYEAQELAKKHADEIGVEVIPFKQMVYVSELDKYMPVEEVPQGMEPLHLSGTQLRELLNDGKGLPEWFTYPEVAEELQKTHRPRFEKGFTVFFTGLSGAGKSTIANALMVKLMELGKRSVTLLDGDIVRKNLSSELGFSKKDRDININRIGYVASEISKHGGIAICAPIAPYNRVRQEIRQNIRSVGGGFILVYVDTPLEECERRDRKGLYAAAKAGKIKHFTGISDPYEPPQDADLTLDTTKHGADELANQVILHLEHEGYIKASS